MTGVRLSELDGHAAWHHHSSSLPHMELVLYLFCHIFLLDVSVIQCCFWWEVTPSGCLWTQALLSRRCNFPWLPAPSEGSLLLHQGTFYAFLSPFHFHERGLSHPRSENMLWRLKFSLPCLPFIYSVCSLLNVVSPTDCGSVRLLRLLQKLC